MKISLLNYTPAPESAVSLAARLCYSSSNISELEGKLKDSSQQKFLNKILRSGHHSVLEHASFTFGIEGISRVTSHQLVRHRIASYSQQSQRYVEFKDEFGYVIPPLVEENVELREKFIRVVETVRNLYQELIESGIPAEDARYILPNASETRIIVSMNARELLHFFKLRCCERAQWEIRNLAKEMLILAISRAPIIFKDAGPACLSGKCPEGDMNCGQREEVIKEFRNLQKAQNYVPRT